MEENFEKMKNLFIRTKGLSTNYLKQFRNDSKQIYMVWKKENDGYFLAKHVVNIEGRLYAEETKPFGDDYASAKKECDILRREYILGKVRDLRMNKTVY